MTAPLLGLIGRKRAGKDTFAAALVESHGYVRVAFADPLRATLLDLNPWVPAFNRMGGQTHYERLAELVRREGWEEAKGNPEVRRLLQAHGVAIREHVDVDIWVRAVMDRAAAVREWRLGGAFIGGGEGPTETLEGLPVVITDVRFPNEADAIRRAGGLLVRVIRPGLASDDTHISEVALDEFAADYDVWNDGTPEDLARKADLLVSWLEDRQAA